VNLLIRIVTFFSVITGLFILAIGGMAIIWAVMAMAFSNFAKFFGFDGGC